jgi:uncharacterized cupredoxin-like copper-binding protein
MNTPTVASKHALLSSSLIVVMLIVAGPAARADETVVVTLTDQGIESMHMNLSTEQVNAGNVTFNVTNASQDLVHEFVVVKSDKPIEMLFYNEDEKEVEEHALKVVLQGWDGQSHHGHQVRVSGDRATFYLDQRLPGSPELADPSHKLPA